jgi:hypothetical protein
MLLSGDKFRNLEEEEQSDMFNRLERIFNRPVDLVEKATCFCS